MLTPEDRDFIRAIEKVGDWAISKIRDLDAELQKVTASRKQFLDDCSDDMECLPECNSYGHQELCPVTNPAAAWRQLREELNQLRAMVK